MVLSSWRNKQLLNDSFLRTPCTWTFDAIDRYFWMLYLSAEFFFLDHIVFVSNVFSFVAILFGVKIKFDITSEFVCVSSKWLVMFHVISHKIQIEKSTLFPIWRRSQPKIKFSDFPWPFHWPNKSIISSPHIYECLMLFNSNFGCIIWTLNFSSWTILCL